MTIRELMKVTQLSRQTIGRKVKEFFPEIIENGKTINLTESQAMSVVEDLRKKGFIEPAQNEKVPAQNEKVDRLDRLESLLEKIIISLPLLLNQNQNQNQNQIEYKQDYFTLKAYHKKIRQNYQSACQTPLFDQSTPQ